MSTFYGSVKGEAKTLATRRGRKAIAAHIRGWDHGIAVEYGTDKKGKAICEVWETGGSNNPKKIKCIATYHLHKVSKLQPGYLHYGKAIGNGL